MKVLKIPGTGGMDFPVIKTTASNRLHCLKLGK
jgi:hypothetical protein